MNKPKPGERLLTNKELVAKGLTIDEAISVNVQIAKGLQDAKTASIEEAETVRLFEALDASHKRECQQRIEEIFREIEKKFEDVTGEGSVEQILAIPRYKWRALKDKNLKKQEGIK